MKVKTKHIDDTPPEQLKGLCKHYYTRARRAEHERDVLQKQMGKCWAEIAALKETLERMAEGDEW